jgi:hypothetical protein
MGRECLFAAAAAGAGVAHVLAPKGTYRFLKGYVERHHEGFKLTPKGAAEM